MSTDWNSVAKEWWDEQPHPQGHGLKIKEFATAVKLASLLKFGGHAEPHEAAMFWREFAPGGVPALPPQDFEHALERISPLSYVYHGRPPTLKEIVELSAKGAADVRKYFAELPDKHHPELTAAEMVKHFQVARPWARLHLEREPVHTEAAYLAHSGEKPDSYYERLKTMQNTDQPDALPAQTGGNGTGRGVPPLGGRPPNQ